MKQFTLKSLLLVLTILMGGVNAWGEEVTYTVASTTSVSTTGTSPEGSSATFTNTYTTTKEQLTKGNAMTLTLSGFQGKKITGITLSMKSNTSKGAGYYEAKAGETILSFIGSSTSGVNFNNSLWNGAWTTSYVDVTPSMTNDSYVIKDAEDVTIVIGATVNSLYCQSFTLTYVDGDAVVVSVPIPSFDVVTGSYTTDQTVKVTNYSSDYTYYYTTDGSEPSATNGTQYNDEVGIEIKSSCTLKMIADDRKGNTSSVASATYTLPEVFSSLEELVAAKLTPGTLVTVSFTNVPIKEIFVTKEGNRDGVYFDIQKDGNDIEIYCKNVPEGWKKEDKLTGTITGQWKLYNGVWEIVPVEEWTWEDLTCKASALKKEASIDLEGKTSLLIGETDVYTVTYSGDGVLSVVSSDPSVATATIEGSIVTITPVAKGKTTITVSAPSTDNYYEVEKTYDLNVSAPLVPAASGYESVDFTQIEPYVSLSTGSLNVEDYQGQSFMM
ncbi:MAG: FN3 associated domain-containing protein, partial [Bacteroidaceae bacterium]